MNLVGEGGLLSGLVKLVLEGALEAELTEHLGYEKGDKAGAGRWSWRYPETGPAHSVRTWRPGIRGGSRATTWKSPATSSRGPPTRSPPNSTPGTTGRWTASTPSSLIDAIYIKIRDGAVANRPVHVAVGINKPVDDTLFWDGVVTDPVDFSRDSGTCVAAHVLAARGLAPTHESGLRRGNPLRTLTGGGPTPGRRVSVGRQGRES